MVATLSRWAKKEPIEAPTAMSRSQLVQLVLTKAFANSAYRDEEQQYGDRAGIRHVQEEGNQRYRYPRGVGREI